MSGRSGHVVGRVLEKGAGLVHTGAFCAFDVAGPFAIASGNMPNTCRSAVWAPPSRRRDSTLKPLRRPDPLQRLVGRRCHDDGLWSRRPMKGRCLLFPTSLSEWCVESVHGLAQQGVFESDRFDLKEMLPDSRDDRAKNRLVKACAAFANSDGGFLIFGVKDDKNLPAEQRLVGLAPTLDFPANFGSYPARVQPSVSWGFRNPAVTLSSGNLIHIVHIFPRKGSPHALPDSDRWAFCKRTAMGTETMSYQEIRDGFIDARRIRRDVSWLKSEIGRVRGIAQELNLGAHGQRDQQDFLFTRFRTGRLRDLVRSVFDVVGSDQQLVEWLEQIMDRCEKADALLEPLASFAILPRSASYSRSGIDPRELVGKEAVQVFHNADLALKRLEAVTASLLGN